MTTDSVLVIEGCSNGPCESLGSILVLGSILFNVTSESRGGIVWVGSIEALNSSVDGVSRL